MELKIIENINDTEWDTLISQFETKSLFHQFAWLNFLQKTQKAKIIKFQIYDDDKIIGYFVGMLEQRGPFKIFSSPRPGCNTEYLGPIINKNFEQQKFLKSLEKWCRLNKIDLLEISNPYLNNEIMEKNKFKCRQGLTYIVNLSRDINKMWLNLDKKSCRYAIHKAEKNGLTVEDTSDPQIIDKYYEQLKEIFGKQKLAPTYPRERVATLFHLLKDKRLLYSLWVKYENKIIATGLFPHDSQVVYFWGGASWLRYQHLCPNDLLHWTLIKIATEDGLKYYDMGGAGSFKPKFGGVAAVTYHWYKSYNFIAGLARILYQYNFKTIQKIKGLKYGK